MHRGSNIAFRVVLLAMKKKGKSRLFEARPLLQTKNLPFPEYETENGKSGFVLASLRTSGLIHFK